MDQSDQEQLKRRAPRVLSRQQGKRETMLPRKNQKTEERKGRKRCICVRLFTEDKRPEGGKVIKRA